MELSTVLVNLEPGRSNKDVLQVTLDCVKAFDVSVVGVAVSEVIQVPFDEAYMSSSLVEADLAEKAKQTSATEALFKKVMGELVPSPEWRSSIGFTSLASYVALQARMADLIITAPNSVGLTLEVSRSVDIGDLVMRAGRPVLLVPEGVSHCRFEAVLVAWKDTLESRRAISDALPFLRKAGHVTIVEVVPEDDIATAHHRVRDVVDWLSRHRIASETVILPALGNDARQIEALAVERGVDLVVAGAYGHSRLREWMMGGVTREILMQPTRCTLLSH